MGDRENGEGERREERSEDEATLTHARYPRFGTRSSSLRLPVATGGVADEVDGSRPPPEIRSCMDAPGGGERRDGGWDRRMGWDKDEDELVAMSRRGPG